MNKILVTSMAVATGLATVSSIDMNASAATKVSGTYVTTSAKSLYNKAGGTKIGKMNKHKKIKLLAKAKKNGKTYYKISHDGGKKHWIVSGKFKKLTVSSAYSYKKTLKTTAKKNYYNLAGGHNRVIGKLAKGKKVHAFKARTVNGKTWVKLSGYGWTPKSNLKNYVSKTSSSTFNDLTSYGSKFLGVPYVWGGTTPSGFDCSGFVGYVYKNVVGKTLPRTAAAQYSAAKKISKSQLKKGDLVFFNTTGGVSHVAMYAGNDKLLHAAGKQVKYSNLYDGYWNKRIVGYGTFR